MVSCGCMWLHTFIIRHATTFHLESRCYFIYWRRRNFDRHKCSRQPNVMKCTWTASHLSVAVGPCLPFLPWFVHHGGLLGCDGWISQPLKLELEHVMAMLVWQTRQRRAWLNRGWYYMHDRRKTQKKLQWSSGAKCWCSLSWHIATKYLFHRRWFGYVCTLYHWPLCHLAVNSTCTTRGTLRGQHCFCRSSAGQLLQLGKTWSCQSAEPDRCRMLRLD